MSQSPPPPGSYEYNTPGGRRHHRHDSHSYFTSSDPYRAVRKSTTPESEAFHSRTESDSSTSRLAPNLPPSSKSKKSSNNNKYHHSNKQQRHGSYYDPYDPYAVPARNQQQYPMPSTGEKSFQSEEQRANSYLPYSHHDRGDPFATPDPVYIEEENLPSFVSPSKGGVGSLLQDNIALDSVSEQQRSFQQHHHQNLAAIGEGNNGELPEIKRRKKKRRCCGLHRRTVVFVVFVFVILVAVAWYFVWPRWANGIEYRGASWPDGYDLVAQDNVIKAVWNVSFTVDNSKNWVPTHVKNYEIKVQDMSTGKQIGEGSTGSMVLSRDSFIPIDVILNIDYSASDPNDATLQSLGSSCTAHAENPGPVVTINGTQSSSLNLAFQITQRITGLVGSAASTVRPSSFQCPIPS